MLKSLQENTISGMIDSKKEEEILKNLFFKFKEIYPNFDKVYDQKMNFLKPAISNASKNELTQEMQDLLRSVIEEKNPDSVHETSSISQILKDAGTIFKEALLAPNDTEVKEVKDECSKCDKNWNWMRNYQDVGIG